MNAEDELPESFKEAKKHLDNAKAAKVFGDDDQVKASLGAHQTKLHEAIAEELKKAADEKNNK